VIENFECGSQIWRHFAGESSRVAPKNRRQWVGNLRAWQRKNFVSVQAKFRGWQPSIGVNVKAKCRWLHKLRQCSRLASMVVLKRRCQCAREMSRLAATKLRQRAGEMSSVAQQKMSQCDREFSKVAANIYISVQANCRAWQKNRVCVLLKCSGWQPKSRVSGHSKF
jgi:hypothetical protein